MSINRVNQQFLQEDALTPAIRILNDPIQSQSIPLDQWIPIAEETHLIQEFRKRIAAILNNAEHEIYTKALAISCACDDDATVFWTLLYQHSRTAYGKAITVTARIYEYPIIASEIKAILPLNYSTFNAQNYIALN